jgi:hypothetical protein
MSESDIIKILIGSQAGLLGLFVWHLFKCRDTRIDIAMIKGSLENISREIGTHESGMRGTLHKMAGYVTQIDMRLGAIERRKEHER